MRAAFDHFVVFAEMRTGSNFLETNLNAFDGVACHGEAFNPHFIAYPNRDSLLGLTQVQRDRSPLDLLRAIREAPGLNGFRFFHDHDPRILDAVLPDPRCAKIILTRNPLDSYVSWKIAQATGQWKLTNVSRRKEAKAVFDAAEFAAHVEALQDFQVLLLNRLQTTGQAPFYVAYEDLQSVEVMNGLADWLGVPARIDALDQSLKRQNPSPVATKVANPDDMVRALAGMDRFNLARTPNFEPRRGASVPSYVAGLRVPLLFQPIKGAPEDEVIAWLAALDGVSEQDLPAKMTQKDLRQWKRLHPGHRSFTVLRHPLARAHATFCQRILSTGPGSFAQIRETLRRSFDVDIPKADPGPAYSRAAHRRAFLAFLAFVRANLAGQTGIRVDGAWCTQAQALQGFGDFASPDCVLREDEWPEASQVLAGQVGAQRAPDPAPRKADMPYGLADIYDTDVEAAGQKAYQRDYMMFGFDVWQPPG